MAGKKKEQPTAPPEQAATPHARARLELRNIEETEDTSWFDECFKGKRKRDRPPRWLYEYVVLIAAGKPSNFAAMIAGVSERKARAYCETHEEADAALTRAKERRTSDTRLFILDVLRAHAMEGSSWHLARLAAYHDPEVWKTMARRLKEADPDQISIDVTADGRPAVTLDQLYRLSRNGGFDDDGNGKS